ncbi:hypothetical protein KI387_007363 [Taxus chinensis]|uniref:RNase H type-1 domain-containing protein n=1 Tax=Taxus chinensis TaxID=29808 RepID=A0AA38LLT1_TAXCH|nr:hypothetical protein KI387_007363 [Taxus chinensis]
MVEVECVNTTDTPPSTFPAKYWTLPFDGARCRYGAGEGVIFTSPEGKVLPFSFKLNFKCTNNGAEYEALLLGLILAKRIDVDNIRVLGDSQLVANQVLEIYETKAEHLQLYKKVVLDLSKEFDFISIEAIPREENLLTDSIATSASRFTPSNKLEDTHFIVSLHDEPLIKTMTNSLLNRNESTILDHVDSDMATLDYLNTYAALHLSYHMIDFSLIPHSSSYFGNPMVDLPSQMEPSICIVENGDDLDLPPVPPEFEEGNASLIEEIIDINIRTEDKPRILKLGSSLTPEEVEIHTRILKEHQKAFIFNYKEMTGVTPHIMVHNLVTKSDAKPVKQKSRPMKPKVALMVKKEVIKILQVGFIKPVDYSQWVSNIVPVLKKNGKIHICIDFQDINKACPKDDFLLPSIDVIVDATTGFELLSLMDGFSGYNQIKISEQDQAKTTFITPWGTYFYVVMPFGLKNAGATYQ